MVVAILIIVLVTIIIIIITLSMEFSRQEYWSGLPFPFPGDLPNPGIEPASLALASRLFTIAPSGKPHHCGGRSIIN